MRSLVLLAPRGSVLAHDVMTGQGVERPPGEETAALLD